MSWTPADWAGRLRHVLSGQDPGLARALADAARALAPDRWVDLVWTVRIELYTYEPAFDLERFARYDPDLATELGGLASLSRNGYDREAIVRWLGRYGGDRAVLYLLNRLGDWVPAVQDAAREALWPRLNAQTAPLVATHLRLLERLAAIRRCRRVGDEVERIRAFLLRPEHRAAVLTTLDTPDPRARLRGWRLLAQDLARDVDLRERALADPWPATRSWLATRIARGELVLGEDRYRAVLESSRGAARAILIRGMADSDRRRWRALLERWICSPSGPTRGAAQWALRSIGTDVRAMLGSEPGTRNARGWVFALGETGTAADADTVRQQLMDERPSVRAAALSALARLDPTGAAEEALFLLADPSPRVRRQATNIAGGRHRPPLIQLREHLASLPPDYPNEAYELVGRYRQLEALTELLVAISSDDMRIVEAAKLPLTEWFRGCGRKWFLRTTPDQLEGLAAAWAACSRDRIPAFAGSIDSILARRRDQDAR